ncbi:hypothetical protein BDN70DRAFT_105713 [Pholiota conissans]|uniref:F-box domain-containing protein n=1 Tax=Pholiota conissans TaxID=109636 RepID=A0A9P6D5J1_9AGAR|nr:hypothetical protein BDN70DRAFT_105713 [Pholiota conissans]
MVSFTQCPCWPCDDEFRTTPQRLHDISMEKAAQISEIDTEVHNAVLALLRKCVVLNRKRNALLPAVNLPLEILATIFELACTPDGSDETGYFSTFLTAKFWRNATQDDRYSRPGPLYIGRVCSVWRDIALGTPQLWNSIQLEVNRWGDEGKQAAALQYWLSNSGNRPLAVGLVEMDEVENIYDMPTAVIDVLVPYAHRLDTATLLITKNWEPALRRIGKRAVSLQSLVLIKPYDTDHIENIPFFSRAPKLRNIRIIRYGLAGVLLPMQLIEHLTMDSRGYTIDFVKMIRLCPNLRHFSLRVMSDIVLDSNAPAELLMHSRLQSLSLSFDEQTDLASRLQGLTLSMLQSFELCIDDGTDKTLPKLPPFLVRSSSTLRILSLRGQYISEDDLVECLRALSELRELYFEAREISQDFFLFMSPKDHSMVDLKHALDKDDGRRIVAPNLITFNCFIKNVAHPHSLISFLENRWDDQQWLREASDAEKPSRNPNTLVEKLRSATFKGFRVHLEDEDDAVLRRLRREGMYVELQNC